MLDTSRKGNGLKLFYVNVKPVFFNQGSAEPKGSANGIQGFRRTAGAQ